MPWKVLYKVSSKHNDRWATPVQPTEPMFYYLVVEMVDPVQYESSVKPIIFIIL